MTVKAKGFITVVRVDDGPAGEDGQMLYATCATAADTADKVAALKAGTLSLKAGVTVAVMFTNANTAANPTLNIAGTGAKAVYMQGIRDVYWAAGATVSFTYDGANWRVASEPVYASVATIGNEASLNVYIDGSKVCIRSGSTVLAAFSAGQIELGKDSSESEVSLCGNIGRIMSYIINGVAELCIKSGRIRIGPKAANEMGWSSAASIIIDEDVEINRLTPESLPDRKLLFSGSLAKGQSKVLDNADWKKYNLFQARTSDGLTIMTGGRYDAGSNAAIRFSGGYDDGTKSYMFKASTTIGLSDNKLTVVGCSMHKYLTSSSGSGEAKALNIVELWGII